MKCPDGNLHDSAGQSRIVVVIVSVGIVDTTQGGGAAESLGEVGAGAVRDDRQDGRVVGQWGKRSGEGWAEIGADRPTATAAERGDEVGVVAGRAASRCRWR